MSDIAIRFENISKQYRLGTIGTGTLSHDLNRWWAKARGKEDPYLKIGAKNKRDKKTEGDYVWALQNINFEVRQGEVLGIIGKNGAGKSTLLKLLSRVTAPSTGKIFVEGRIASLLEVGTGFHPEMTGRENVFLNGAIMGMTKAEIRMRFDEIVAFTGVENYIDTPVKRYSSGMVVRLGFAVAAHLEPEILVVDEVLAVGDAEFQKKAIGKMQDVSAEQGRTVLFVSHNMGSIQALCNKVLVMEKGGIYFMGNTIEGIETYFGKNELRLQKTFSPDNIDTNTIMIKEVQINGTGDFSTITPPKTLKNTYIRILFTKHIKNDLKGARIDLRIDNALGQRLIWISSSLIQYYVLQGDNIVFQIPDIPLKPGVYHLSLYLHDGHMVTDWKPCCFSFEVQASDRFHRLQKIPIGQTDFIVPFNIV